jgi:hypothetical protein
MWKLVFGSLILACIMIFTFPNNSRAAGALPNQSYYCQSGSAVMMIDDNDASLQKVYETCKPGDTIGLAQGSVNVQRLCDFTKTITLANRVTVCVLASLRPTR